MPKPSNPWVTFIRFGVVGLSNTGIFLCLYYLLVWAGIHYQIANSVGFIISSLNGFLLSRTWVFPSRVNNYREQLAKYYLVYGTSLIVSALSSYVLVEILMLSKYIAPILNLMISIPYNFIFSKYWAFARKSVK